MRASSKRKAVETPPASRSSATARSSARDPRPSEAEPPSARPAGLPAAIAENIRQLITRGALAPGVHLGQTELADRFGASRVPVREALKLLTVVGLVSHDPNRGFFVAQLSSDEARQLYRLRHLVETEVLTTIRWPNEAEIADFNARIDEMETLLRGGDRLGWSERHRDFHIAMFNLSPQKLLVQEILRLWSLTDRYRSLLPSPVVDREGPHGLGERMLVDALVRQDRAFLIRVFKEDRARVEKLLLDILRDRGL